MGFIDDVVIRISRERDKTRVDIQSRSREGLFYGGCNAKRAQGFLKRLEGQQTFVQMTGKADEVQDQT